MDNWLVDVNWRIKSMSLVFNWELVDGYTWWLGNGSSQMMVSWIIGEIADFVWTNWLMVIDGLLMALISQLIVRDGKWVNFLIVN